jgi:hypothetical protein
MYDSAYYAISGYVVADTTKTKFLFLFLPRKEKIRDAIGVQYWWSVLSLKEYGWGPPSSVLKMVVHQQKSPGTIKPKGVRTNVRGVKFLS